MKQVVRSQSFQALAGCLVSVVLIGWLAVAIEWRTVWAELLRVNVWAFLPMTLVFFVHHSLRSWRWRYFLNQGREITFERLFEGLMIGNFANFVLPLRAGEFIRPFLLSRYTTVGFGSAFVSIVIERFFDLSTVLLLFGALLISVQGLPDWTLNGAFALGIVAAGIVAFIILGTFVPEQLMIVVRYFLAFLPKAIGEPLEKFVQEFLAGAKVIRDRRNFFGAVVLTTLVWYTAFLFNYVALFLLDIEANYALALAVTVIVSLAVAAPSAPGFIGIFQTGCIAAFVACGSSKELGVTYAILSHVFQYIWFIIVGVIILARNNLSWRELQVNSA